MFAYRSILHEHARPAAIRENRRAPWLAVSVVCFGAFMGQLDASIGYPEFSGGNPGYAAHHGYPGAEQARLAFIVLAVVAATAAVIALVGRGYARTGSGPVSAGRASQGGGPVRCRSLRT